MTKTSKEGILQRAYFKLQRAYFRGHTSKPPQSGLSTKAGYKIKEVQNFSRKKQ